jgi:ParB/RepB/Spo0J family partition protein
MSQPTTSNARALPKVEVVPFDRVEVMADGAGKLNPRKTFDAARLGELKETIDKNGLINPPTVRPKRGMPGHFELVAGERRYRALCELHKENPRRWPALPALVHDISDAELPVVALVENIAREDLTPTEVAEGLARAIESGSTTEEHLTEKLGWTPRTMKKYLQFARAPKWLREAGNRVAVATKKLDEHGVVQLDPKTKKPQMTTKVGRPLDFTFLNELLRLHNKLLAWDKEQLDEGAGHKPVAEREVKKLIEKCAMEEWPRSKLEAEITKALARITGTPAERTQPAPYLASETKLSMTADALRSLPPEEAEQLARQVEKFFKAIGWKNILISP